MPMFGQHWAFTKESVAAAENVPGVYALYCGEELVYYGSSENSIRSRLQSHLNGYDGPGTKSATTYVEEPCTYPLLRESLLISEFEAVYGRKPRFNEVQPRGYGLR